MPFSYYKIVASTHSVSRMPSLFHVYKFFVITMNSKKTKQKNTQKTNHTNIKCIYLQFTPTLIILCPLTLQMSTVSITPCTEGYLAFTTVTCTVLVLQRHPAHKHTNTPLFITPLLLFPTSPFILLLEVLSLPSLPVLLIPCSVLVLRPHLVPIPLFS